jgi:hypothetical protein
MVMFLVTPALSVTVIVAVPAAHAVVGVPDMTPAELIVIPAGSPIAVNVYGDVLPDTALDIFISVIAVPTVDVGILYVAL